MKNTLIACAALFATLGTAQAQIYPQVYPQTYLILPAPPPPSPARFLVGMGLSGGGDELASARAPNGSTEHIHAGGLVYFTAGIDYHFTPQFSLQGTINYHVDSASTGNGGDIRFERFPIELIGYYQPNPLFRVGGGVRYTSSPTLTGSSVASNRDLSFDNTTSAVVEAEYFADPEFGIKLRYVHETFKARGVGQVDGSHVGLSLNYYF
jgi:hypothetical protein